MLAVGCPARASLHGQEVGGSRVPYVCGSHFYHPIVRSAAKQLCLKIPGVIRCFFPYPHNRGSTVAEGSTVAVEVAVGPTVAVGASVGASIAVAVGSGKQADSTKIAANAVILM